MEALPSPSRRAADGDAALAAEAVGAVVASLKLKDMLVIVEQRNAPCDRGAKEQTPFSSGRVGVVAGYFRLGPTRRDDMIPS